MNTKKLMTLNAMSWEIIAVFSVLLMAFHAIPDLTLTVIKQQGSYVPLSPLFSFPYWMASAIEPLMALSSFVCFTGFYAIWKQKKHAISLACACICIFYGCTRLFWGICDYLYAKGVNQMILQTDLSPLYQVEMYKGLGAAVGGISGVFLTIGVLLFFKKHPPKFGLNFGLLGSYIIILTIIPSIFFKVFSLTSHTLLFTVLFLMFMTIRSIGITFIAISIHSIDGDL